MTRGTWQGSGTWQTSGGMTAGGVAGLVIVALAIGWAGKHARGIGEATVIAAIAVGAVFLGAIVAGIVIAWRSMCRRGTTWTPASVPPVARQAVIPQVTQGTQPAIEQHNHFHFGDEAAAERILRKALAPQSPAREELAP